jgi:hypothetical protein
MPIHRRSLCPFHPGSPCFCRTATTTRRSTAPRAANRSDLICGVAIRATGPPSAPAQIRQNLWLLVRSPCDLAGAGLARAMVARPKRRKFEWQQRPTSH